MNKKKIICDIEKDKLSNLQSSMSKLINTIKDHQNKLSSNNLCDLMFVNQNIDKLISEIETLEIKICKKTKNKYLSDYNKERIENYNNNQKVIDNFLPYMMAYSMMISNNNTI